MIVGSLFSGIGGLDLGLARAGFRHAFFCEADPYRRRVLARHWPGVPCFHAVQDIAPGRDGRPGPVDLLCGGFPCEDVSVAGRRAGLRGERSGLFFEFARVAAALLPAGGWVLLENVPGLLSSHGGRDFALVLATLADLRVHDCAWRVLDSRYFGVPQRRRRVYLLGRRARGRRAAEVLLEPESGGGDFAAGRDAGPATPLASLSGLGSGGPDDNDGQGDRLIAPALTKNYGKQPDNSDTNLGPMPAVSDARMVRRLTPRECERLQGFPDDWTCLPSGAPDSRRYAACGDAVTVLVAEWIGRRLFRCLRA